MTRLLLILAAFIAGALFTLVVASGMGGAPQDWREWNEPEGV